MHFRGGLKDTRGVLGVYRGLEEYNGFKSMQVV